MTAYYTITCLYNHPCRYAAPLPPRPVGESFDFAVICTDPACFGDRRRRYGSFSSPDSDLIWKACGSFLFLEDARLEAARQGFVVRVDHIPVDGRHKQKTGGFDELGRVVMTRPVEVLMTEKGFRSQWRAEDWLEGSPELPDIAKVASLGPVYLEKKLREITDDAVKQGVEIHGLLEFLQSLPQRLQP